MKFTLRAVLAIGLAAIFTALTTGATWGANNRFAGDWNLDRSRSRLTDVMKVERLGSNRYRFDFGVGNPETITIDGTDQPGMSGTTLSASVQRPDAWKVVRTRNLKQDGKDYPNTGANAAVIVASSLRRIDEHTLEVPDKNSSGTVYDTRQIKRSSDLKALTISIHVAGRDEPNILVFERLG